MTDKEKNSDEIDPFSIKKEKIFEVIIDMLIEISARQRVLEELFYKDAETKGDLNETLAYLKKSEEFHKNEVYKSLFYRYSDLSDLLPPNVRPPGD